MTVSGKTEGVNTKVDTGEFKDFRLAYYDASRLQQLLKIAIRAIVWGYVFCCSISLSNGGNQRRANGPIL